MPTKFTIRQEISEDSQQVAKVVKSAFEQGQRGYDGEGELVEKLRSSPGYIPALSMVAEVENQIVGHIILSRVYIHTPETKFPTLILAPVSVLPEFQNQGVRGLIKEVHRTALELGEKHVFVLGHATYYPKFGYEPSRNFGITFPEGRDDDHCMGIELVKRSLTGVAGKLEYSKSFYEV